MSSNAADDGDTTGPDSGLENRMLGEFQLLRRLGRGGMATVYLAEQTSLKRSVAVKVLLPEFVNDATYLQRFKTEAMAAAGLNHPNIVQVYVIGQDQGLAFIAQEYVQGMNLRDFITKKGPPDLTLSLHIMRQAANALQAAGAAGIVHRDLKPENILMTRKGEVKVADFGLAQLTQHGKRVNLTEVGVTMGTPLYMSPEQVHGQKLDHRSDVYSLGVTFYHLLAGNPPFRGESAIAVAMQHVNNQPQLLEELRPDLPIALCQMVHKMMAKKPDDRYADAQAVIRDIKRISQARTTGENVQIDLTVPLQAITGEKTAIKAKPGGLFARIASFFDRPAKGQLLPMTAIVLTVAAAAAGLGFARREGNPLLLPVTARPEIPKQANVALQYLYAMKHPDDVAAWQAVVSYFDDDAAAASYRGRARQQILMLQLQNRQFDEAMLVSEELTDLPVSQSDFRALGIAGKGVVLAFRNQPDDSLSVFQELTNEELEDKLPRRMQELVATCVKRNLQAMQSADRKLWEKLIDLADDEPDEEAGAK